jgi:hypothetical protein
MSGFEFFRGSGGKHTGGEGRVNAVADGLAKRTPPQVSIQTIILIILYTGLYSPDQDNNVGWQMSSSRAFSPRKICCNFAAPSLLGSIALLCCQSVTAAPGSPVDTSYGGSGNEAVLEEIVVTATKRTERLLDVPLSVSAITADEIQARGFNQFSDYINSIPGVYYQDGGIGSAAIHIRGATESGVGSTVGTYFGEAITSVFTNRGGKPNLRLVDIDRVEVLRGPQGTLFGADSLAGVLRIIPAVHYMPYALHVGDIAGAVVAVVKDGKVLTERGYGYSDVEKRAPVDPKRTLFRPGSVSKLVTWTAVMQLVEQGKIDLDADVNQYLDFKIPPRDGKPVTMRNIMQHTAGFEEQAKGVLSDDPNAPGFEALLKQWVPHRVFPAGSTPAYSNYGASLAGYVVQRLSGEPFNAYVEKHIFAPLDMQLSTFRQPLPANLAP